MEHVAELAGEHVGAELWALHSDRLARGDGRSARHAVEVALWALKREIKVRTVEDPDTFRDLLYAVVTGQRNHEDSRRKGLAVAAGRKRGVARGDFTGAKPDGYRRAIDLDQHGTINRRLEIDPARQPLIAKIFQMALAGRGTGEITRAVGNEGWLTKPMRRSQQPKPWTTQGVREVLMNPRYAGLAMHHAEVLARGHWPSYITERQHHRIKARLKRRRPGVGPTRREVYILARLASCARCGSPMHCLTGALRNDGTFARRYVCRSQHWHRHSGRCPAPRIDADVVEAMFISVIGSFLLAGAEKAIEPAPGAPVTARSWADSSERERVLEALLGGSDQQIDAALEAVLTRASPEAAMLQRIAITSHSARQVQLARRFGTWASSERVGRTDATRTEARKLNGLLRAWFSTVELMMDGKSVVILAHRRAASGAGDSGGSAEARFDRREWVRWSPAGRGVHGSCISWDDSEIIGALQAWVDAHGCVPRARDWDTRGSYYPTSDTVCRRFGSWPQALIRAGLSPSVAPTRSRWSDAEILTALQGWAIKHGRAPSCPEWGHASLSRPGTSTVANHFGTWRKGLEAAGLSTSDAARRS
jgi:hypothetical protein